MHPINKYPTNSVSVSVESGVGSRCLTVAQSPTHELLCQRIGRMFPNVLCELSRLDIMDSMTWRVRAGFPYYYCNISKILQDQCCIACLHTALVWINTFYIK